MLTGVSKLHLGSENLLQLSEAGEGVLLGNVQLALDEGQNVVDEGLLNACLLYTSNQPSIAFYRSLGAVPLDEWTTYRLTGDTLEGLAKQAD